MFNKELEEWIKKNGYTVVTKGTSLLSTVSLNVFSKNDKVYTDGSVSIVPGDSRILVRDFTYIFRVDENIRSIKYIGTKAYKDATFYRHVRKLMNAKLNEEVVVENG